MVYMGSKRKYTKYIIPIIQDYIEKNNISTFIDCFVGGANIIDKIDCNVKIGNDLSPSLIALHQQAQIDFSKIPTSGNREFWDSAYSEWKNIKKFMNENNGEIPSFLSMNLSDIGAIEWYGSFSNGGFPRGYAKPSGGRDYYKEAYKNHMKQVNENKYKDIIFIQGDYRNILNVIDKNANVLLYCDSPYKGTKPYGINNKFNFEEYYDWLRNVSTIFPIFISEQNMPNDFNIVWEKEAARTCGKDNNFKACEKLYLIDNRKSN